MPERIVKSVVLICLVFICCSAVGQARSYSDLNWAFGNSNQWISFNKSNSNPVLLSGKGSQGVGGAATASHPVTGDLLFYTDGVTVFDASHQVMTGGLGLAGNSSANQPVAICAVPGLPNQYYVFSNSADYTTPGTIFYTVVDMNQFGNAVFPMPALGEVNASIKAKATSLNNTAEAMIIVSKSDLSGFWLISKRSGNNDAYDVLDISNGLENITGAGSFNLGDPTIGGNISYNEATGRVAVSSQIENRNIQILQFDNATGILAFDSEVLNTGYNNLSGEAIYDTEWSGNGNYLYISIHGGGGFNGDLLQYNYNNPLNSLTSILPSVITNSYGLKMAPDGNIYHLFQSGAEVRLARINEPDSIAAQTNYELNPLGSINFNGLQFPEFLPEYDLMITADFTFEGLCANVPTHFFPEVTPVADSILWDFGDGTGANDYSPIHTFDGQATPYTVGMTAFVSGQSMNITKQVNILAFDVQITLVADTVACKEEFPPPRGSSTPTQFSVTASFPNAQPTSIVWSNGDTGATLTPDSAGFYYVVATLGTCSISASVNVQEYGLMTNTAAIWYFGQEAGIDFNDIPPTALSDGVMTAIEGCTAVSDQNGQILFYTDGSSVFDQDHNEIATNIGGDPDATQSVMAVPFPSDQTLYYIFTAEAVYGTNTFRVKYSIFDLKLNNGTGEIIKDNVVLFEKSTERLTSNGGWLILHEFGNNTFRAYPILASGIGTPVLSSIGSVHSASIERNGHGYMKLSQDNSKLAIALSNNDNSNFVEMFNFDPSTGELSNYTQLDLGAQGAIGQVYGIEFSPGGNKIFATVKNSGSSLIYEYRADTLMLASFIGTLPATPFAGEFGSIQYAPDGQLYVAINGSQNLGVISVQEDVTQLSTFNAIGFTLAAGKQSLLGLPNFVQNFATQTGVPGMSLPSLACVNNPVDLVGNASSIIDEFEWTILSPSGGPVFSSQNQTDTFTPTVAGTYTVNLRVFNRCGLDQSFSQPLDVIDNPPPPDLLSLEIICDDNGVTLQALIVDDPALTYAWSTGETSKDITVLQQGNFTVTITNPQGCTSSATVLVLDARPQVELGPALTVCQGDFVTPLNAGVTGATYAWTLNGGSPSSAQTRAVDTSVPGVFKFVLFVQDPAPFSCSTTDSVTVTVLPDPVVNVTVTPSPGCNMNQGQIDINITSTGFYSYTVSGPTPSFASNFNGPTNFNLTNLAVGFYNIVVTDEISGCSYIEVTSIVDAATPFAIQSATSGVGCGMVPVTVNLSGTPAFPVTYSLTNQATGVITNGNGNTDPFTTSNVDPGNYTLLVTDAGICTQSFGPFNVTEGPKVTAELVLDNCTNPATLTVITNSSNPVYSWTGPILTPSPTSNKATVEIPNLTATYSVTVADLGPLCDSTVTITVTPIPFQSASITSGGTSCDGQQTLTANVTPPGNYSFLWIRDGNNLGGQVGQFMIATVSGEYTVRVRNQQSGCDLVTNPLTVEIFEPITVSINSGPLCDNGEPFTLKADAITTADTVIYEWSRNGSVIAGQVADSLQSTTNGIYEVTATTEDGCSVSSSYTVTLSPVNVITLPEASTICPLDSDPLLNSVELDAGTGFTQYMWFDNNGNIVSNNQVYTASIEGKYTVIGTNQFGCTTEASSVVIEDCVPRVFGPNAFRPKGTNDEFFLFTKYIIDFEIFIYNRWGGLVYHSNQEDFRWDGIFEGRLLPAGTYAYKVRFKSEFNPLRGMMEKHGGVTLLR